MRRSGKKRANLRDVARAAGVSVATVSRVLNSPMQVSPDTRARVNAKITELNFMRSAAARAINTGRSKILGALIPTLNSDIFALTISALENRLADFGFSLVVATTDEDPETETRKAQELLDIGVEGLVLSGITHSHEMLNLIERAEIPAIVISYHDPSYHLPTIGYDNEEAGQKAFQHLIALGHKRIAVVHGPVAHNDRTRARLAGIKGAPDAVEVAFFETELSVSGGCQIAARLLREGQTFDAFLCVSDLLAFGVIFELQRAGHVLPQAASVMGIHDLPGADMIVPRLSTIRLPVSEMGQKAAEALADWVERDQRPAALSLPTVLVERESTPRPKPPETTAPMG